jgi:hypothetical protein
VVEVVGRAEGSPQAVAIFDVAAEVADAGVEDVVHGVASEEEVADDAHAPPVGGVRPQSPQIRDRVYYLLLGSHHCLEISEPHPLLRQ